MFALPSSLSTRARRGLAIGVMAGSAVLVASACSSGSSTAGTAASTPAAAGQAAATTPATAPVAQPASHTPATVAVAQTGLGPIVVDTSGRTLYRYDKDTAGNGMSACYGACAAAWPAALTTGQPTAPSGLTGTLGEITRSDGSHQLTLDGSPLYRYVGDQGRGATTGDGFGGIWHVLHSTAAPASAPTAAAPSGMPGY